MSSALMVFTLCINKMNNSKIFPTGHLMTMRKKRGWFIRWYHWFGWYLPSSLTRWFNRRCFQRVIWCWGIRRKYNSIQWYTETFFFPHCIHTDTFFLPHCIHTDTFFFPYCIIMTSCVSQFFLSLVYHFHHIRTLLMLIFVRVKSKSQGTIGF